MSTPKLVFDMDGTIANGKFIDFASLKEVSDVARAYLELAPYDIHTVHVWNMLCQRYDIYICTWRSYDKAVNDIRDWLRVQGMYMPQGIICGEASSPPGQATQWKVDIVKALNPVGFFDDHPKIIQKARHEWSHPLSYKMYNPEWDGASPSLEMISSWKQIGALFL